MSDQPLFIHSDVDDFGLSANLFRIVAHVARRGSCYAAIQSIAATCRLHPDTVRDGLRQLEAWRILQVTRRPGQTNVVGLAPFKDWQPLGNEWGGGNKGTPLLSEGRGRKRREGTPRKRMEAKVLPLNESKEGSPDVVGITSPAAKNRASDFLQRIKASEAYVALDIEREHAKAEVWCRTNRRRLTERFFVNWLNRCDRDLPKALTETDHSKPW